MTCAFFFYFIILSCARNFSTGYISPIFKRSLFSVNVSDLIIGRKKRGIKKKKNGFFVCNSVDNNRRHRKFTRNIFEIVTDISSFLVFVLCEYNYCFDRTEMLDDFTRRSSKVTLLGVRRGGRGEKKSRIM